MKTILLTGIAGFVGYHLAKLLAPLGYNILGVDIVNDYYSVKLKENRLRDLGIVNICSHAKSNKWGNISFYRIDITDFKSLSSVFDNNNIDYVVSLAGIPGVRYSFENPHAYVSNNISGFLNILELSAMHNVSKVMFASSSSVYGNSTKIPFSEDIATDNQMSVYAVTKKCDELLATCYSNNYRLSCIGLRFFTCYGSWGRPDMAPIKFMKSIMNGDQIHVYNYGNMLRDFTHVFDIVEGIKILLESDCVEGQTNIFNIGSSNPVRLLDFVTEIENVVGRKADIVLEPMQKGDVLTTYSDIGKLHSLNGYTPKITIKDGLHELYAWLRNYDL